MSEAVFIKITSCQKCPHLDTPRHYTGDSFEMVFDWRCKKKEKLSHKPDANRIGLVDWGDKSPVIPQWCPLREETKQELGT